VRINDFGGQRRAAEPQEEMESCITKPSVDQAAG